MPPGTLSIHDHVKQVKELHKVHRIHQCYVTMSCLLCVWLYIAGNAFGPMRMRTQSKLLTTDVPKQIFPTQVSENDQIFLLSQEKYLL